MGGASFIPVKSKMKKILFAVASSASLLIAGCGYTVPECNDPSVLANLANSIQERAVMLKQSGGKLLDVATLENVTVMSYDAKVERRVCRAQLKIQPAYALLSAMGVATEFPLAYVLTKVEGKDSYNFEWQSEVDFDMPIAVAVQMKPEIERVSKLTPEQRQAEQDAKAKQQQEIKEQQARAQEAKEAQDRLMAEQKRQADAQRVQQREQEERARREQQSAENEERMRQARELSERRVRDAQQDLRANRERLQQR